MMSRDFLSPDGQRRKLEMRAVLQGTVVRRRRRRRAARAAAYLILIGIAGVVGWPRDRGQASTPKLPERPVARYDHVDIEIVTGDAERVASWVVRTGDASRFYVSDDSLSDLLVDAGHAPGFLRIGSRVEPMVPLPDVDTPD